MNMQFRLGRHSQGAGSGSVPRPCSVRLPRRRTGARRTIGSPDRGINLLSPLHTRRALCKVFRNGREVGRRSPVAVVLSETLSRGQEAGHTIQRHRCRIAQLYPHSHGFWPRPHAPVWRPEAQRFSLHEASLNSLWSIEYFAKPRTSPTFLGILHVLHTSLASSWTLRIAYALPIT